MFRVGFCVSGQGSLFRYTAECAKVLGIEPALLIVDEKADRGLESFCLTHDIEFLRLDSGDRKRFDEELVDSAVNAQLDLIVLTFDKLVPNEIIEEYRGKIINVHMSLLPSFKGFKAIQRALDAGVKYIGASIHEVTDDPDSGSIISQCLVSVRPDDDDATVGKRLYSRLLPMYMHVIHCYSNNRIYHDEAGRVWIKDADYSDEFTCPAVDSNILNL